MKNNDKIIDITGDDIKILESKSSYNPNIINSAEFINSYQNHLRWQFRNFADARIMKFIANFVNDIFVPAGYQINSFPFNPYDFIENFSFINSIDWYLDALPMPSSDEETYEEYIKNNPIVRLTAFNMISSVTNRIYASCYSTDLEPYIISASRNIYPYVTQMIVDLKKMALTTIIEFCNITKNLVDNEDKVCCDCKECNCIENENIR